ncbi:hypothetical protein [Carboxylicivirga marina]|uniref:Uncharacterized protein n=1 Tax=Carboxylicivirga marina TaxID=2800988 RepID=A0ABS1HNB8_9BACT|nr:hypothetical protein [Carboxylicivirga marina]MBK3519173.1 hypothetical protein [Carboxylicivirga marina]
MSIYFNNNRFLQGFGKLYHIISNSNIFGIRAKKLIFKPEKEITIHPSGSNMSIEKEKHYHRVNTRPVAEKQSILKEEKKIKHSE